jgi:hypothetical protein
VNRDRTKSLALNSCATSHAPDQQHDSCGAQKGRGGGDRCLEVLSEATVATESGEAAFDHPSAGMRREADLIDRLSTISTAILVPSATREAA